METGWNCANFTRWKRPDRLMPPRVFLLSPDSAGRKRRKPRQHLQLLGEVSCSFSHLFECWCSFSLERTVKRGPASSSGRFFSFYSDSWLMCTFPDKTSGNICQFGCCLNIPVAPISRWHRIIPFSSRRELFIFKTKIENLCHFTSDTWNCILGWILILISLWVFVGLPRPRNGKRRPVKLKLPTVHQPRKQKPAERAPAAKSRAVRMKKLLQNQLRQPLQVIGMHLRIEKAGWIVSSVPLRKLLQHHRSPFLCFSSQGGAC